MTSLSLALTRWLQIEQVSSTASFYCSLALQGHGHSTACVASTEPSCFGFNGKELTLTAICGVRALAFHMRWELVGERLDLHQSSIFGSLPCLRWSLYVGLCHHI